MCAFQYTTTPWNIAAPSFVWSGRVGENCYYLENMVDEVELVFFETEFCLNYDEQDLPGDLINLDLDFHLHLPLDLPWNKGIAEVIRKISKLNAQVEYLSPHCFVLHPPADPQVFMEFYRAWKRHPDLNARTLLLENVRENNLLQIWSWIEQTDCRICLDLGHLLHYRQQAILDQKQLWNRLEMLHIYGEQHCSKHTSLQNLSSEGQDMLKSILQIFPREKTLVVEVFTSEDLTQSLDILSKWIINWELVKRPC